MMVPFFMLHMTLASVFPAYQDEFIRDLQITPQFQGADHGIYESYAFVVGDHQG